MNKIILFVKKEIVFIIATFLAIISAFFVPPSLEYIDYIDFNVLILLFSFMAVANGLKEYGFFDICTKFLCSKVKTNKALFSILIFLCFFFSMLVTNDVALLTFVPFTIILLSKIGQEKNIIYILVLQTISANLGSMATPMGNPQNLFLYSSMNISFLEFFLIPLPFTILSGLLLFLSILPIKKMPIENNFEINIIEENKKFRILFICLFLLCILSVIKIIPLYITFIIILAVSGFRILKKVDYILLLTFCSFFIFTGNISCITQIKDFLHSLTAGKEFFTSILTSQIISNVPATLLLYPFSENTKELLLGVNFGGLGTIIASLASLISFKLYSLEKSSSSGKFMIIFSIMNLIFLSILILFKILIC